jgi:hypothetical protein
VNGEGSVDRFCYKQSLFLYPRLIKKDDKNALDADILGNWGGRTVAGAFDFRNVDVAPGGSGVVDYSVYYNKTLTATSEVPVLMNMVTNALWRLVMGNSSFSEFTNVGRMDFPTPRTRNTIDIITLGART